MRTMRCVTALAVMTAMFSGSADAADCLKANAPSQVAEGRLRLVKISTPAYNRRDDAYILTLRSPACLDGEDFDKVEKTERIHVFSTDAAMLKRLKSFDGKSVRVTGSAFGEHTAHHHAPIVMSLETIEPR